MRIMIAYDGSECADRAIDDLDAAGLPDDASVMVLTVAEQNRPVGEDTIQTAETEATETAELAARRLHRMFPKWNIHPQKATGSVQSTLLQKIEAWKPDLAVVGSHGRSGIKRLALGSVSHYVLTRAACSVRIGRAHSRQHAPRVLIGTDGSDGAQSAIVCAAGRHWPAETQIRIVSVADARAFLLTSTEASDTMYAPVVEEQLRIAASAAVEKAKEVLIPTQLGVTAEVRYGMPADMLIQEAQEWKADCIFVGARGLNALERIVLGSVSTTVAVRAPCSVEVVRVPGV